MYFARRFVDGSTEICFGYDDSDQFGAKLRFSEEHILHIATNLLRYADSYVQHKCLAFSLYRRLSREYYYAPRCSRSISFFVVLIPSSCRNNEAKNFLVLFPRGNYDKVKKFNFRIVAEMRSKRGTEYKILV